MIDFIYYVQFHVHTNKTLDELYNDLQMFHAYKEIFQTLGIWGHFNIPKIHTMIHYLEAIMQRDVLDGYNMELSECLHIDFAKEGYHAGNHCDYIAYMTTWLQWQEAMHLCSAFLQWLKQEEAGLDWPVDIVDDHLSQTIEDGNDVEDNEEETAAINSTQAIRITKKCPHPCTMLSKLE